MQSFLQNTIDNLLKDNLLKKLEELLVSTKDKIESISVELRVSCHPMNCDISSVVIASYDILNYDMIEVPYNGIIVQLKYKLSKTAKGFAKYMKESLSDSMKSKWDMINIHRVLGDDQKTIDKFYRDTVDADHDISVKLTGKFLQDSQKYTDKCLQISPKEIKTYINTVTSALKKPKEEIKSEIILKAQDLLDELKNSPKSQKDYTKMISKHLGVHIDLSLEMTNIEMTVEQLKDFPMQIPINAAMLKSIKELGLLSPEQEKSIKLNESSKQIHEISNEQQQKVEASIKIHAEYDFSKYTNLIFNGLIKVIEDKSSLINSAIEFPKAVLETILSACDVFEKDIKQMRCESGGCNTTQINNTLEESDNTIENAVSTIIGKMVS